MKASVLFTAVLLMAACTQETPIARAYHAPTPPIAILNPKGNTLQQRFNVPEGYTRIPANAYTTFLRQINLQPEGSMVHYYNGQVKNNPNIYAAVLTYDVCTKDLQQCADAVMRIRAEYLFATGQKEKIHFRLTNGFVVDYNHWIQGYRLKVNGNKVQWVKAATPASDHNAFRQYLDVVYAYAGTLSLSKELKPMPYKDMLPGDVLIVGGSPGHAVTVMDMAVNKTGKKVFMLSQSYMPAQEIQVLHNPANNDISPWYELDPEAHRIITPQWEFTANQLMRFVD